MIFGAWDSEREQGCAIFLRKEWEFSAKNIRQLGYTQEIEHLQYIQLYTFNMVHSPNPENPDVAVIKDFERRLRR